MKFPRALSGLILHLKMNSNWKINQLLRYSTSKIITPKKTSIHQPPIPRTFDELPMYFDYPGEPTTKVCLSFFQESHREAIEKIWKEAILADDGLAKNEDFSAVADAIKLNSNPMSKGLVLQDITRSEIMGAVLGFPCPMCRSEEPLFGTAMLAMNQAYRAKGTGLYLIGVTEFIFTNLFCGNLGRAAVTSSSISLLMKWKLQFLGTIPNCTEMYNQGWINDNVVFKQTQDLSKFQDNAKNYRMKSLTDRSENQEYARMISRSAPTTDLPTLHHKNLGKIRVTFADPDDIWEIQHILRKLALSGEGFGLDEFNNDGVYNEKLILNCHYWVVRKETDGEMVAIILSGESKICRSPSENQVAGNIIVLEPFRRQGLGQQLLEWCENQARILGHSYILTDILACNTAGIGMTSKGGFYITSTLPKSCIVKGSYTDSLVHWKPLKQEISSKL